MRLKFYEDINNKKLQDFHDKATNYNNYAEKERIRQEKIQSELTLFSETQKEALKKKMEEIEKKYTGIVNNCF
jgi:hypothetical protein